MDNDITLRDAKVQDAAGIATLLACVWPDDTADPVRIARVIQWSSHLAKVAVVGKQIAGLVRGFVTQNGAAFELEVELLAVHPDVQGRGLAKRLVFALIKAAGEAHQIDSAWALVRIGNVPAERVFTACGFEPNAPAMLYVSTAPLRETPPMLEAVGGIVADTYTYRGIWIHRSAVSKMNETELHDTLISSRSHIGSKGIEMVSTVLPHDHPLSEQMRILNYEPVGEYRWFVRRG